MKLEEFLNAAIYDDKIDNEVPPPSNYTVFKGAWYYKVVSSLDKWLGIEAIITLPEWEPDKTRYEYINNQFGKVLRYLDTPSIYLGGSSDFETDIGFGFFQGYIGGKIIKEKITFRPFWRTIHFKDGVEKNIYSGTKIEQTKYYYFPGDTVKINLICDKNNFLTLRIELLEETSLEPYKSIRNKNDKNEIFILRDIIAPGNGLRLSEYKRVNAIDQYHNEGKETQNTSSSATNCEWKNVYLFRLINNELRKIPFIDDRIKRIFHPDKRAFVVKFDGNIEKVDIIPLLRKKL